MKEEERRKRREKVKTSTYEGKIMICFIFFTLIGAYEGEEAFILPYGGFLHSVSIVIVYMILLGIKYSKMKMKMNVSLQLFSSREGTNPVRHPPET